MKKKHGILSLILSVACIFNSLTFPAFAHGHEEDLSVEQYAVIEQYERQLDENLSSVFEKCENGTIPATLSEDYTIFEEQEPAHIRVYEYQSPEYNTEDGVLSSKTSVFSISASEYNNGAPVNHDPVYGRLTIWYTKPLDSNGLTYWRLTRVSCDFSLADGSFSIVKQNIFAAQSGVGIGGAVDESKSKDVSGTSWSVSTGFSKAILPAEIHVFGARWTVTYKRQASTTYTFTIDNLI